MGDRRADVKEHLVRSKESVREALQADDEDFFFQLTGHFDDDDLADLLAGYLPLLDRWFDAEFDTEAPSRRGMGRIADGDPPPRIGARFRKLLSKAGPQEVGQLKSAARGVGLSSAATFIVFRKHMADINAEFTQKPADEVWLLLLRSIVPMYHSTQELVEAAQREQFEKGGVLGLALMLCSEPWGSPLAENYDRLGLTKGFGPKRMRTATTLPLYMGVGCGLANALSDDADPNLGAAWQLELLENYEQPRKARDVMDR